MERIAVIGGGAWGTALAAVVRRAGRHVRLWALEAEVVESINRDHENAAFLPGIQLDPLLWATTELEEAVRSADAILLVPPAQHLRAVAAALAPMIRPGMPVAICSKGIEQGSCLTMSEVLAEVAPEAAIAVLSGPTLAPEVARGLPTGVTLACRDEAVAADFVEAVSSRTFKAYAADDVIGAELGGAVKNVIAIGCGIGTGLRLGENARATFITRGLAEMVRLARAKGGRADTLMGLSGLGDLVLTCNAASSRNASLGVALGEGRLLGEILGERRSVTEGVQTAESVVELARRLGVEMPICQAVYAILHEGVPALDALESLLGRPTRPELDFP
ncbi:MAG: NAD(P)H-dependent glycerol-3-phosphate dehydrogenase [Dehalococcoidia bacterium]